MLELRVSSPRILFCDAIKFTGKLLRFSVLAVVVVILGVLMRIGYQKVFIENEDFVLQEMLISSVDDKALNFVNQTRVIQATGINPEASIFAFDVDEVEASLSELPEVSYASVSRRLPGTLKIEIRERVPVAWLACPSLGIGERDPQSGLLASADGEAFLCDTQALADYAAHLPVVFAERLPEEAIAPGRKINHEGLTYALEMAQNADALLDGSDLPDWVMVRDELTLEMQTVGGTRCTLSYFDQQDQLARFRKISRSAQASGRRLATINLIPKRYVPVTYLISN
ncbi:MAG: cell division protein FtsQ/DivIB [Akkermansiaceae bacterium]